MLHYIMYKTSAIYTFTHTYGWLSELWQNVHLLQKTNIIDIGHASAASLEKGYSIYEFMKLIVQNVANADVLKNNHNHNAIFYTSVIAVGRRVLWPDCCGTTKYLVHYSASEIASLLSGRRVRIYHIFNKLHQVALSNQTKIKFGYLKFSALSCHDREDLVRMISACDEYNGEVLAASDLTNLLSINGSQYIESYGGVLYPVNIIKKMFC